MAKSNMAYGSAAVKASLDSRQGRGVNLSFLRRFGLEAHAPVAAPVIPEVITATPAEITKYGHPATITARVQHEKGRSLADFPVNLEFGLHARVAAYFIRRIYEPHSEDGKFQATLQKILEGKLVGEPVLGNSMVDIMALEAGKGSVVRVSAVHPAAGIRHEFLRQTGLYFSGTKDYPDLEY